MTTGEVLPPKPERITVTETLWMRTVSWTASPEGRKRCLTPLEPDELARLLGEDRWELVSTQTTSDRTVRVYRRKGTES